MDDITRPQLLARGMSDRRIRAAVARGELVRLRPGHFSTPSADERMQRAVALGGRLACVSELRSRGVWVLDDERIHLHVPPTASRLRSEDARVHWRGLLHPEAATSAHVGAVDALVQAHRCLDPIAWIASLDSALRLGIIRESELAIIRAAIRRQDRHLIELVDRRAESGLESIARVIARELGFRVRSQVRFPGVGRVDLLVEDWVVVETDGSAFHDAAVSARDRLRDARLSALGRTAIRPGYSLVVYERQALARQLIGAVASHRRVKDAGRIAIRARRRMTSASSSWIFDGPA